MPYNLQGGSVGQIYHFGELFCQLMGGYLSFSYHANLIFYSHPHPVLQQLE